VGAGVGFFDGDLVVEVVVDNVGMLLGAFVGRHVGDIMPES